MPDEKDPQPGARFSHVYAQRGEPTEDSPRMRRRIAGLISQSDFLDMRLKPAIESELGIAPPYTKSWANFLADISLQDVLDLITVAFRVANKTGGAGAPGLARLWLLDIERIFREENVHYRVEPRGGVRFYIDEDFSRARTSTIAAMSGQRYSNALAEYEKGMGALAQAPPDGKSAIKGVFGAAEALFRLITGKHRLGAPELDALSPILQRRYAQDVTTLRAAQKMLASFKDWVDAAHFYRHEQGTPEPVEPPLQIAVYIVDSSSAHIRWLAEFDTGIQAEASGNG